MQKHSKICYSLASVLSVASDNQKIDFLVYGHSLNEIERSLIMQNCKAKKLNIISAVAASTTKANFNNLKFLRSVSRIAASAKVSCLINKAKVTTSINKLHEMGFSGRGVTVAIIDTGVSPHLDLTLPYCKVKVFKNFLAEAKKQNFIVEEGEQTEMPFDDNGHGTFIAGVIASSGLVSAFKYKGVAPNANLVVLKALDASGESSTISILEALEWVSENKEKYNIKVLCLSIGAEPEAGVDPLAKACESLAARGVCVVAAAGNSGPEAGTIKSPGISGGVITVGAADDRTTLNKISVAGFSSRGPYKNIIKPDCVAPGVNIVGLSSTLKSPYIKLSGTSMAAPIVAGFCALLLEKNPRLSPLELKYIVKASAKRIEFNANAEGSGLIDAKNLIS